MENNNEKTKVGVYRRCALGIPEKYDDYLVKTKYGTYEFAFFGQEGWRIQGDNSEGNKPIAWTKIPTTPIKG